MNQTLFSTSGGLAEAPEVIVPFPRFHGAPSRAPVRPKGLPPPVHEAASTPPDRKPGPRRDIRIDGVAFAEFWFISSSTRIWRSRSVGLLDFGGIGLGLAFRPAEIVAEHWRYR
jgi:hypothetical protein